MKIPLSYLIAVPVRGIMKDKLIKQLAEQITLLPNMKKFTILAMPEGLEREVIETAQILYTTLLELNREAIWITKAISDTPAESYLVSDDQVEKVLGQALGSLEGIEVLIIVIDLSYAQKIPRVFIWNFLCDHKILSNVDLAFSPGEAGIVDCRTHTRDVLHPEGYESYLYSVLVGL